ncbi:TPA: hypothetical protein SMR00_005598 [Pseudomonas aeruginosa]|nr:hypothetical protein [Pseudomonas aeruginosa]
MSKVKRFDHVNHAHIDDCEHVESSEGAWVTASDYDALAAKLAMAEDAAAKGDAARQQCGGMEMEIEELRAELAELRARVVVVPEHKDDLPPIYEDENLPAFHHYKGWNACLDELARLNGKTVSEGLLRRLARPADRYDEVFTLDRHEAAEELRALLSEQA